MDKLPSTCFTSLTPTKIHMPCKSIAYLVTAIVVIASLKWFYEYLQARKPGLGCIAGNEATHLLSPDGVNIPIIHSCVIIKSWITAADVVRVLQRAGIPSRRFQRLQHCVSASPDTFQPFENSRGDWPVYWFPEPSFSHEKHVDYLPEGLSQRELKDWMSGIMNMPPTFTRSPWEILVANALDGDSERTALILRLHHVLGDGLSVLGLLEAMSEPLEEHKRGAENREGECMLATALTVGLKRRLDQHKESSHPHQTHPMISSAPSPCATLSSLSRLLHRLSRSALFGARMAVEVPWVLWRDYIAAPPERNMFKPQPLSGRKKVAWSQELLEVARLKRVKDKLGVKVNDVLLACATGALRTIMLSQSVGDRAHFVFPEVPRGATSPIVEKEGESEEEEEGGGGAGGLEPTVSSKRTSASPSPATSNSPPPLTDAVRVFLPMSVRTNLASLTDLDNQLSVLSVALPTGLASRRRRLAHLHALTSRLKDSTVPLGVTLLTTATGALLPRRLLEAQADFLCHRTTGVVTNVPGPVHRRRFAGHPIEGIAVLVPAVSSIGMVLSTFTYGEGMSVGLVLDEGIPCRADEVLEAFAREFEKYEALAAQASREKVEGPL